MAQIAYTNGISLRTDVDVCGLPVVRPIQDDPVREIAIGAVGWIDVIFKQGGVEKARATTDGTGLFVALLEEGTYDIVIDDDRYEPFSKPGIVLTAGTRAPYVGYVVTRKDTGTEYPDLIIKPDEVRELYLFGLVLVDRYGRPFSDDSIAHFIRAATAKIETLTDINIKYRKILASSIAPENPDEYEVIEPGYDYDFRDFSQWTYFKVRRRPLIDQIQDLGLVYPVGRNIFSVPQEWIRTYFLSGQVQLVPTAGAINRIFLLPTGQYAPLVSWYLPGQIPQVLECKYEVGMIDKDGKPNKHLPENIFDLARHIVGLDAAIEILGVTGDAILAGIASQSISGDGISESFSTTASATSATYQARIESYRKDLQGRTMGEPGLYEQFKAYWSQISLVVA